MLGRLLISCDNCHGETPHKSSDSTGDPVAAVKAAVEKPIMQMMYGAMFKYYLRDRFMAYMGINGWNTEFDLKRIAELA